MIRASKNWVFLLFFGIVLVLLGITLISFRQPIMIWLFATLAAIDGVATIIAAIGARKISRFWWIYLLVGLIGIAFGLTALLWSAVRDLAFVYVAASWAVFIGVFKIAAAVMLVKTNKGRILPTILGIVALGLGIFIMAAPDFGASVLFWLIACIGIISGVYFIIRAFLVRKRIPSIEDKS
jgi:uncharacterized membrane protein HdeD (DUF308 family)